MVASNIFHGVEGRRWIAARARGVEDPQAPRESGTLQHEHVVSHPFLEMKSYISAQRHHLLLTRQICFCIVRAPSRILPHFACGWTRRPCGCGSMTCYSQGSLAQRHRKASVCVCEREGARRGSCRRSRRTEIALHNMSWRRDRRAAQYT